tara:strand:- start:293 stop:661 length:369 start_codon:yes stop_codon:yes gene_type:complete
MVRNLDTGLRVAVPEAIEDAEGAQEGAEGESSDEDAASESDPSDTDATEAAEGDAPKELEAAESSSEAAVVASTELATAVTALEEKVSLINNMLTETIKVHLVAVNKDIEFVKPNHAVPDRT